MTQPQNVLVASAQAITGHQFRFKAGVPGCSCGEQFPEDTGHAPTVLHAVHLAPFVVVRVLRSAAAALHAELPPADAAAAVSALAGMVRDETPAAQREGPSAMSTPAAARPATSFHNPRVWAMILTLFWTVLVLGDVWTIIALDPGFLTSLVQRATESQVGAWFGIVLASAFGIFAALRYLSSTFVAAVMARQHIEGPALASVALVLLGAGIITGHLLEYGCVALLIAMVARFFIDPSRPVSAD